MVKWKEFGTKRSWLNVNDYTGIPLEENHKIPQSG
jgi:hypothetical protein